MKKSPKNNPPLAEKASLQHASPQKKRGAHPTIPYVRLTSVTAAFAAAAAAEASALSAAAVDSVGDNDIGTDTQLPEPPRRDPDPSRECLVGDRWRRDRSTAPIAAGRGESAQSAAEMRSPRSSPETLGFGCCSEAGRREVGLVADAEGRSGRGRGGGIVLNSVITEIHC